MKEWVDDGKRTGVRGGASASPGRGTWTGREESARRGSALGEWASGRNAKRCLKALQGWP